MCSKTRTQNNLCCIKFHNSPQKGQSFKMFIVQIPFNGFINQYVSMYMILNHKENVTFSVCVCVHLSSKRLYYHGTIQSQVC